MKARILVLLAAGSLLTAAAIAYSLEASAQSQGSADDEQTIKQVITAVLEASNRHDAKASTALFTDDADFVNVFGMWWKGAAEIERARKARFETALKGATFKLLETRISFLRPDVAIAHVTSEITGLLGPDGQPMPAHSELSLRVLIKQDGKWRVRAFHNTTVASSLPAGRER